jgi:sodium/bile acid cotransporter 2
VSKLSVACRRAVSFETGIQNSPLAFAIIIASFPDALHQAILMQPMLYALCVLITSSLVAVYFRFTARGVTE